MADHLRLLRHAHRALVLTAAIELVFLTAILIFVGMNTLSDSPGVAEARVMLSALPLVTQWIFAGLWFAWPVMHAVVARAANLYGAGFSPLAAFIGTAVPGLELIAVVWFWGDVDPVLAKIDAPVKPRSYRRLAWYPILSIVPMILLALVLIGVLKMAGGDSKLAALPLGLYGLSLPISRLILLARAARFFDELAVVEEALRDRARHAAPVAGG